MERKFEAEFKKFLENKMGRGLQFRTNVYHPTTFKMYPFSMQWCVLLEFFEKKGIIIDIQPVLGYNENCYTKVGSWIPNIVKLKGPTIYDLPEKSTRDEARKAAFEKAKQILENQSK